MTATEYGLSEQLNTANATIAELQRHVDSQSVSVFDKLVTFNTVLDPETWLLIVSFREAFAMTKNEFARWRVT